MSKSTIQPNPTVAGQRKHAPRKPEGCVEDREERRRLVNELRGSMPELPPVEEFIRQRGKS